MRRRKDPEQLVDDVVERQRNTVFPDTPRGGRSVDELVWRGWPGASLVQRIGILMVGLCFLIGGVVCVYFARHARSLGDSWLERIMASGAFLLGGRLCYNAFRTGGKKL